MPELPEVETIVRTIAPAVRGRTILNLGRGWPATLRPTLRTARRMVLGARVQDVSRRGKFVVVRIIPPGCPESIRVVFIHLRMSGRLAVGRDRPPEWRHVRFWLEFDDGSRLWLDDARKFARVIVSDDPAGFLAGLGAEPLGRGLGPRRFAALVHSRRRWIKPLLLDQSVVAGLGNIYTDEALHAAGIHPLRRSDRLSSSELVRLYRTIRGVLKEGIGRNGASIDWVYPGGRMQDRFRVYGRADEPCRTCGARVRRIVVGQRGTWFCPGCQRVRSR